MSVILYFLIAHNSLFSLKYFAFNFCLGMLCGLYIPKSISQLFMQIVFFFVGGGGSTQSEL